MRPRRSGCEGFSLIEIAIVLVIVGVLAGGGVSLFKVLIEGKARSETGDYMQQSRAGLINYAITQGRFPCADTDGNGVENVGSTRGELPWFTLHIPPRDAYKRAVRYEVNASLTSNRGATCAAFKAGLAAGPSVVDADGPAASFRVAAVLVSGGPTDGDGDGSALDGQSAGSHVGNNRTGTPNYLRAPPGVLFDDIVAYLDGAEISLRLCQFLQLAVNNASTLPAYVYDATRLTDLGALPAGQSGLYSILSGTRIEVRSAAAGGGSLRSSAFPRTPLVLAGQDATITVP
jgi:prepilin-type N-terminal cleavage/methylation domain-containing protein